MEEGSPDRREEDDSVRVVDLSEGAVQFTGLDQEFSPVIAFENQSVREQFLIFLQAMIILQDRYTKFGDSWKRGGWKGNVHDFLRKAARIDEYLWRERGLYHFDTIDIDDLTDAINYAAFSIRNIDENNKWGK